MTTGSSVSRCSSGAISWCGAIPTSSARARWRSPPPSYLAELRGNLVEAGDLQVGLRAEIVHGHLRPIAPAGAIAERLGSCHVPGIGRHEEDLPRGGSERARPQLVNGRSGLVGPDGIHGEHVGELALEAAR